MEFIIKKEAEKFNYYLENVNIPYNEIGGKMLEYSTISKKNAAIDKKKSDRRCVVVVVLTIISTIALWAVLSWWMILIWWFICFLILGAVQIVTKVVGVGFKFEKESDKKSFEKLNNLLNEIKGCTYKLGEDCSYISYGIDGTFKIEPNVWYSKIDGSNAFFMPGFLFYKKFEAIEYTNVEVANVDTYGNNYPLVNKVDEEQIILNTWRYTNIDGSKNNVRKDNFEKQIIKASELDFTVNNNGKSNIQRIHFSNRELAKKIIKEFKVVFPDIHYREILIEGRTNHQRLAFLFLLISGGTGGEIPDSKEYVWISNFLMKIEKTYEMETTVNLVSEQMTLYMNLSRAAVDSGGPRLLFNEMVALLNVLKNEYNQELCQEIYDVAKEVAFADGIVDDGERIMLNHMKDILDASDAKGKSRVGAIDDLGKKDDINDSRKQSSF